MEIHMKFTKLFAPAMLAALSLAFAAESALATQGNPSNPLPLIVEQRLNSSALTGPLVRLGTQVTQKKVNVLKAVYDFSILGGASGSSLVLKDSDGGDATLPKNAIVKNVMVRVATGLTGSQSGVTLKCGWNSTSDNLLAATAISTLSAAPRMTAGAIVAGTVSGWKVVDDGYNVAVGCKIAVGTITAGKAVLYIEYYLGAPQEP
jgi:hypothetical protein